MRNSNSFTEVFSENHNIRYSAKQLEYLEKHTALFLLNLFTGVYQNLGKSSCSNSKTYELPTLRAQVDVKVLPMAWNTSHPPQKDRYCDLEDCIDVHEVGCILTCEHAYHFECLLFKIGNQCQYCVNYLVSGIESNCKAFQKSVSSFDGMITDEYINELNVTEIETGDTNNDEDFIIYNNIDLQFERAVNALTSA